MEIFELLIVFFVYLIPMYITNATPILIHGKQPLDFRKKFRGRRILGKGKTIVGTFAGITAGFLVGILFGILIPNVFQLIPNYFYLVFILSVGAIFGDLVESFCKRQMNIKSGGKLFFWDQLDFIIGGLILSLIIRIPEIEIVIVLSFITIFIHGFTNLVAFKAKLKKVPW
jgi:CDP-2,3-bis-(O-geranylgeranyl)-sn-glycerol synthase